MNQIDLTSISAAHHLQGLTINGWEVLEPINKHSSPSDTGGNFSICYKVRKDGNEYFMKVLDYKGSVFSPLKPGEQRVDVLARIFTEFNYERDLSLYCNSRKISKVILYIDSGQVEITQYPISTVSYIVYEMANGNIRKFLKFSNQLDFVAKIKTFSSKLKSLRDVATGLSSLHDNLISHQDLKPSNIMQFDTESKIGDLGRSLCFDQDIHCPYPFVSFHGDWNYAPPEAFFWYHMPDEKERLYQMDNYTLGSLIVFYLTGVSLNAIMDKNLPNPIRDMVAKGVSFEMAKAFLLDAFQKSLSDIRNEIPLDTIKDDLLHVIEYLCYPIPERRGHPLNVNSQSLTPSYDLHRTISELDLMYRKSQLELSKSNYVIDHNKR